MAVTITGGKYSGAITSVGTTTLTNSGASFVSGDFAVRRIVGLWNAAGTTYKGMAWIRRFVSSTALELEQGFIDKNGNAVTQVAGDTYLVSKNYADSVTAGLAIVGNRVNLTDGLIFGTNGISNSVCFYDERVNIVSTIVSTTISDMAFRGGLIVHGHLSSYADFKADCGCNFFSDNGGAKVGGTGSGDMMVVTNAAAKVWWLGGSIFSQNRGVLPGGQDNAGIQTTTSAEWQKWWDFDINNDLLSPNGGLAWPSSASDQQFANIRSTLFGSGKLNVRVENADLRGGSFSLKGDATLAPFGSNSNGVTFSYGPTDGLGFLDILDIGSGTAAALWRVSVAAASFTQTINWSNVRTVSRKHGSGSSPGTTPAPNVTGNFRFYGRFTGLQNGSLSLIKNNSIRSDIENSGTVSGSTITLQVLEAVVVGSTETVRENSWLYGFYKYGYSLVTGNFATTTLTTTAGSAKAVVFGGFIGQVLDANITQGTEATVAAYTTIDDLDQLYDYAQYFKALNTTNAIYPTVANQIIAFATGALTTPTAQNIVINTAAASVFAAASGTITIKPTTALTPGSKGAIRLSAGRTLTFTQNGDKSAVRYEVPATGIVVVANGPTNLVGSTFATINVSSGTATVTVSAAQLANITAGAGVTLVTPATTIQVAVTGPSDYYVTIAQGSTRLNPTDTGIQTGPYSFSTQATGSATVRVRRQGWSDFETSITLNGSTVPIGATITQEVDPSGEPLYTGTSTTALTVTIDSASIAHKVDFTGNATVEVQQIYDEVQDAKVSPAGMLVTGLTADYVRTTLLRLYTFSPTSQVRNPVPANQNCFILGVIRRGDGLPIDDAPGNGSVQVVSNLGQTQQETRDALLLAPTVGATVEDGSIDDQLASVGGGGTVDANIISVDGQPALASNSVDFDSLGTITDGIPRSNTATAQVITAGTVTSGGFATTAADDGTYFAIAPTASGLDLYLEFVIGSQFPSSITVNGRYTALPTRWCNVFAWNWQASVWEQISDSNTRLNHTTSDTNYAYSLLGRHREGVGTGRVRIRFQSTDTVTTYSLNLDQVILKSASASATAAEIAEAVRQRVVIDSYRRDFGPTIDTVAGVAGAVVGDNGIPQNPSNNIVDALAIAQDSRIGAKQFFVEGGSSLVIPQGFTDWGFLGQNEGVLWAVALNGQSLPGCVFSFARVSGTGLSTTTRTRFNNCVFDDVVLGNAIAFGSVLGEGSSITAVSGADISLRSCFSVDDDEGTRPIIDFASPAALTKIRVQDHNGGVNVRNMNANSVLQFSGQGLLTIEASCTAGQVSVESTAAIVNLGGVTVTRLNVLANVLEELADIPTTAELTARTLPAADYFVASDYTAPANASIAAILEDTGTTIPAQITALPSPLNSTATQAAAAAALTAYDAATGADVQVTVSGGFLAGDRVALTNAETHARRMAKQLGLVPGVAATHSEGAIVVSDGDGSTTIADNLDGSFTVGGAP